MMVSCLCAAALCLSVGAVETPLMVDTFEDATVGGFPDAPQVGTWTSGILQPYVGEGVLDGHDLRFDDPGVGQFRVAYATTPSVGVGTYRYDFEFMVLALPSATGAVFNFVTSDTASGVYDRLALTYNASTGEKLVEAWFQGPFANVGTWDVNERHAVRVEFDTGTGMIRYFIDDFSTPVFDHSTVGIRRESATFSTFSDGDANVAIDNVRFTFVPQPGVLAIVGMAGAVASRRRRALSAGPVASARRTS